MESGRVRWSLVGSGRVRSSRVERSRVEWSQQLTVDSSRFKSIRVESSHGVEFSAVESTVDSSQVESN